MTVVKHFSDPLFKIAIYDSQSSFLITVSILLCCGRELFQIPIVSAKQSKKLADISDISENNNICTCISQKTCYVYLKTC